MRKRFLKSPYHLLIFLGLILLLALIQRREKIYLESIHLPVEFLLIPYYAFCSFYRMLGAYFLSLFFSLSYGYLAATQQRLSRFMLPGLDILQSIPVLGFFPAALYFFVKLSGGSRLGVEIASIFLIFTGQAWNMAFGVYESISTIPNDSKEAMDSYGLKGFKKFRRLYFPASIPKLVYNSIISWGGGWYFLIACEIITIGPINYKLPGLGSFLVESTQQGKWTNSIIGLITLIAVIVLMDLFVWRPLSLWAEKFRYEFAVSTLTPSQDSFAYNWWRTSPLGARLKTIFFFQAQKLSLTSEKLEEFFTKINRRFCRKKIKIILKKVTFGLSCLLIFWVTYRGGGSLLRILNRPWPRETGLIPFYLLASGLRLLVAYLIALCWTIPLSFWVGESEQVARIVTPLAQIGASIPATALFPFIVAIVITFFNEMNIAAILLILTGMQWYLLFNLIGGIKSIPGELKEAAKSLGLSRWQYWKKVALPASYPSLITGSITAWGGGWNSLIVSEYIVYNQKIYSVRGIGYLLDRATYLMGDNTLILVTLISMVSVIALINHFFWRRLYLLAMQKYKIEY